MGDALKKNVSIPELAFVDSPRAAITEAAQVEWETAPLGVVLWGVYGPDCFPTIFPCKLRNYPVHGRAIWGFSIYRRKPSFRTLGTGKDWADKNGLRLFRSKTAAFAEVSRLFAKAEGHSDD